MNQQETTIVENKPNRKEAGMALASVLAFAVVISVFVAALLDTMLPIMQKTAQFKGAGTARSFADLGLDYAVQQLNAGLLNCPSSAGASVNWNVPASVINDANSVINVTVAALPSAATAGTGNPPGTSILYDPLLNVQNQYAYRMVTVTSTYGAAVKQLRCLLEPLLTVNAAPRMPYGIFGIVSVVYAGQAGCSTYNGTDPRTNGDTATLGKISEVYGSIGVGLASRSIVEGGSHYEFSDPSSYYSSQYGILAGLTSSGHSSPWATITGNIYSNNRNTSSASAATGPADTFTAANTATWLNLANAHNVLGITNGITAGSTIPTGSKDMYVPQASPAAWTGGLTSWNVGPTNNDGVTYPQPTITTTPTAPTGSSSLGNLNLNNATLVIDSTAASPAGPLGTVSNATVRIPPGAYTINSLTMANNSSIQFTPATQAAINSGTAKPVSFYVSGSNNGAMVVTVDNTSAINMNNGITNPSIANGFNTSGNIGVSTSRGTSILQPNQLAISPPGNSGVVVETAGSAGQFQLYYSGSSFNSTTSSYNTQIILSGNQRMIVYAPSAGVLVGSPAIAGNAPSALTKSCNYYGALVGASVGVISGYGSGGGTFMHYDANLRPTGMTWLNPWQPPPTLIGSTFGGYRAVTWQEAVRPNSANAAQAQWTYQ